MKILDRLHYILVLSGVLLIETLRSIVSFLGLVSFLSLDIFYSCFFGVTTPVLEPVPIDIVDIFSFLKCSSMIDSTR